MNGTFGWYYFPDLIAEFARWIHIWMGAPTLPWNVDSIINFQGLLLFLGFAVEEGGGFKCEYVKALGP